MLKKGRKTKEWETARRYLKNRFLEMGVTSCELHWPHHCWRDNGLSFAHSKKRRYIKGDEIYECALLCPIGHDMVERLPHQAMYKLIRSIIENRERKLNEQHAYDAD